MTQPVQITRVSKTFGFGAVQVQALKDINLEIKAEEFVAIVGASKIDQIMQAYAQDVFVFDLTTPRQYVGASAYRRNWEGFLQPGMPVRAHGRRTMRSQADNR